MKKQFGRLISFAFGAAALALGITSGCGGSGTTVAESKAQIGRAIFFDKTLSTPVGQSCGSCHVDSAAFSDPRQDKVASEGAVAGLFGFRQATTIKYSLYSPPFHFDLVSGDYVGGQFWDGRAVDLQDQAHFPVLGKVEMNNDDFQAYVNKVAASPAGAAMRKVYGATIFSDVPTAMNAITDAIAAFEKTPVFHSFSSKYDRYLKGMTTLTPAEARGLALFEGKAGCANCHSSQPGPRGEPPLFTDFSYDNIGLPKTKDNPFYTNPSSINPDGANFVDVGLMGTTHRPDDKGRFRVPTLRNLAVSAPYFHNGFAKTIEDAIRFYNARDLGGFDAPEVPETMNKDELGNLGLTEDEIKDIATFIRTLTDGQ